MLDQSQEDAVQNILGWAHASEKGWISLVGPAGSGKSTILGQYILPELTLTQKLRVAVATPTARAARVLSEKLSHDVLAQLRHMGTIHSLMYKPVFDEFQNITGWAKKHYLEDIDVVVLDECSMIDHIMEEDLLSLGVPILAVGDACQLSPINGISTWMKNPSVTLDTVHRQALESPVLRLATYIRERGRLPLDMKEYDVGQHIKLSMALPIILDMYDKKGMDSTAVACFTNSNRCRINLDIQWRLFRESQAVDGTQFVCLKNHRGYGICNGDRGILSELTDDRGMKKANLQMETGDKVAGVVIDPSQFGEAKRIEFEDKHVALLDFGYAMTVHKLQGSSVDEIFIVKDMPRSMDEYGKFMYTAVTRAVSKVHFISRV